MIASSWNYLMARVIRLFTGISMKKKKLMQETIMQSRIGALPNIGIAMGGLGVHVSPHNFYNI